MENYSDLLEGKKKPQRKPKPVSRLVNKPVINAVQEEKENTAPKELSKRQYRREAKERKRLAAEFRKGQAEHDKEQRRKSQLMREESGVLAKRKAKINAAAGVVVEPLIDPKTMAKDQAEKQRVRRSKPKMFSHSMAASGMTRTEKPLPKGTDPLAGL